MSKHPNRRPFFARLLDDQAPSSDMETKKFPSDNEDFAWSDTPVTGAARQEKTSPQGK